MSRLIRLILQGLAAVLPVGLTLYFLYWLAATAEQMVKPLLLEFIPSDSYIPGFGIITTIVLLLLLGLVINVWGFRYLLDLSDRALARIPLVKSLYGALQDMMRLFSLADTNKEMKAVVSLDIGNDTHVIGLVTGESTGKQFFGVDKVGVYIPLSYQIGGMTVYVERSRLTPLDISVEEAMRITLTGGVSSNTAHS